MANVDISELVSEMEDWIGDGCNRALVDFVEGIPVPVRTGRMLASRQYEFGSSGFQWNGAITFDPQSEDGFSYASVVDDGDSFTIVPVNKKALFWEGLDHPVMVAHWHTDNGGWFTDNIDEERWANTVEDDLGNLA